MTIITLNGISLVIAFNMATQIGFEEISGKPFHEIDLNIVKDKMALLASAVISNNPDKNFDTSWLMKEATQKEIKQLEDVVLHEVNRWAGIPSTLAEPSDPKSDETTEATDQQPEEAKNV